MKKGDTFIGLDGKRYRVGKTVWRKDINKEIAKMTSYTPPPPRPPYLALIIFGLVATGFFAGVWAALAWAFLL